MSTSRRALAPLQPSFGRRARAFVFDEAPITPGGLGDDARLFAMTLLGGFLFVSVYLA